MHIFIADVSLHIFYADFVKRLIQTVVGHYRGYYGIIDKFPALFHVASVDVHDLISVHHLSVFIHGETSVGIAVIRETHVELILNHEFLKSLYMSRAAVTIDIGSVRIVVHDIYRGPERLEYRGRYAPCRSVGAVETDSQILQRIHAE